MTVAAQCRHVPDAPPDREGNQFCAKCGAHYRADDGPRSQRVRSSDLRVVDTAQHPDDPGPAEPPPDDGPAPDRPTNLPPEFWSARPTLKHIREAAHAHGRSADLVLAATLARLSAMIDPHLKFETGLGPGSMNLFTAIVGPSGVGKTAGVHLAQDLLPAPKHLEATFRDAVPLGSGEGLAEAFMGQVTKETGELTARGKPRTQRVRGQVRKHVFVFQDEGEALVRSADRRGATIGSAIRSAWVGATLGQTNASDDTTRILGRNAYALGLLIGFQRSTALPLLADSGPGTPQRFWWASAIDPSVPPDPPEHPGTLFVQLTDALGEPLSGLMQADGAIRAELWQRNLDRVHGDVVDDDLDSHEVLLRSKVAALLALLAGRHDRISLEDWNLAYTVWETSCAVRDSLLDHGRDQAARTAREREQIDLQREVRKAAELDQVPSKIRRLAYAVADKVAAAGGMTNGAARKTLASRDRDLYEAAVERAAADGLLIRGDSGLLPTNLGEVDGGQVDTSSDSRCKR